MKTVFSAKLLLPFRFKNPKRYDPVKGHTGVDLQYNYETFYSHVTGKVVHWQVLPEMGLTFFVEDAWGAIHVLSHFSARAKEKGDTIVRGRILGTTGGARGGKPGIPGDKANAGKESDGPHVHWEVIIRGKPHRPEDKVMTRSLCGFTGWNTDPIHYTKDYYGAYKVPVK